MGVEWGRMERENSCRVGGSESAGKSLLPPGLPTPLALEPRGQTCFQCWPCLHLTAQNYPSHHWAAKKFFCVLRQMALLDLLEETQSFGCRGREGSS